MATTPTNMPERIAALEDARYRAMVAGDVAGLGRFLSDRLTYTHSTALTESKAEYLASVAKGVFRYREIKISERVIRGAGGAAPRDRPDHDRHPDRRPAEAVAEPLPERRGWRRAASGG